MSSASFEPDGSSSGRELCTEHTLLPTILHKRYTLNAPYRSCIYSRLPEDEHSGSKRAENIKIKN